MEKKEEVKMYKGYSLFLDVDDFTLRCKNRGVLIANMIEENYDKVSENVTPRGMSLVLGYFNSIPELERRVALDSLKQELLLRGIKYE